MSEIADFIKAQYDRIEQAAKLVRQPYRLYVDDDGRISEPKRVDDLHGEHDGEYEQWADGEDRMPNHIVNWSLIYDPAEVLADIESKREILKRHYVVGFDDEDGHDIGRGCAECGYSAEYSDRGGYCETVRLLAAPFSDEPGYKAEEWAVE